MLLSFQTPTKTLIPNIIEARAPFDQSWVGLSGIDISTCPLAPVSEFLKKGLLGKYILVFTYPIGQDDFLKT